MTQTKLTTFFIQAKPTAFLVKIIEAEIIMYKNE